MTDSLKTVREVADFLQSAGYSIGKSAVSNHIRDGKLKRDAKGKFPIKAVEKYAAQWLGGHVPTAPAELVDLQEKRLEAEVKKLEEQGEHWRMKNLIANRLYVERARVERDLAARARVLKSDLGNFMRSTADEMVALVAGDPDKIPDLIELYQNRLERWMDRYSREGVDWGEPLEEEEADDESEETEEA